ncbi:LexA family protein [Serratia fonticola]|uniref:LexA family protein n=1 Tax=Serratia fonticola TaxID=47917 RepID=UPI0036F23F85
MVQDDKVREEFSQRLALACKRAGLDEHGRGVVIARELGMSSKGVSKWFNAESIPRPAKMLELAKYLNVDVVWLQLGVKHDSDSEVPGPSKDNFVSVPLLSVPQVGYWMNDSSFHDLNGNLQFLQTNLSLSSASFAMKIPDKSMRPEFSEGDIVIFDPAPSLAPGDFVVANVQGGGIVFRKYRARGPIDGIEAYELVPLNEDYPTYKSDTSKIRLIGVMMEHRRYRAIA